MKAGLGLGDKRRHQLSLAAAVAIVFVGVMALSCNDGSGSRQPPPPPPSPSRTPSPQPPPPPPALPDLVIASSSRDCGPIVTPGTSCRFSFVVMNRGKAPYAGYIVVSGPGNVSGGFSGGLGPGETKTAIVDYPFYSRGATYTFHFTVDPDNVIQESDETNNTSATFTVQTSY